MARGSVKRANTIARLAHFFLGSVLPSRQAIAPSVIVLPHMRVDGFASPSDNCVYLRSGFLRDASVAFLHQTIAHEVAHFWWDQRFPRFFCEAVAEFFAIRFLGFVFGEEAEKDALRRSRGYLYRILVPQCSAQELREGLDLGRGALALHSWWRRYQVGADNVLREVLRQGGGHSEISLAWQARTAPQALISLMPWLEEASAMPAPRMRGGVLRDEQGTGLGAMVAVDQPSSGECKEVWLERPVKLGPHWRVSDQQLGPVVAGNLAADTVHLATMRRGDFTD